MDNIVTRAKFEVQSINHVKGGLRQVVLAAVSPLSKEKLPPWSEKNPEMEIDENLHFSKYTPAGKIEISITNPNVELQVGRSYYVDIIDAAIQPR